MSEASTTRRSAGPAPCAIQTPARSRISASSATATPPVAGLATISPRPFSLCRYGSRLDTTTSGRGGRAPSSPSRSSPYRKRSGPVTSWMRTRAASSVCTCVPQPGKSRATTDAKPSVMPACDTSPVHTWRTRSGGTRAARAPTAVPSRISAMRSAASASAAVPTTASASTLSDVPTETKKITRTGEAPRCTAVFSASP